jgi:hypothetical protein
VYPENRSVLHVGGETGKSVIYHVYANQSNVGDWLSARGIQQLLWPFAVRELFCDVPFVPETIAALNKAGPNDLIVIGGGGLFMDYFTPFWEAFRPIPSRVPFVIWGVGYCDWKTGQTRAAEALLSEIVRKSQLCVVRDELTRQHLKQSRLPPPVPCSALIAVRTDGGSQKQILHVDSYDVVGETIYRQMVTAAQQFAELTERSYRQTNNQMPKRNAAALQKILDLYRSADIVLSSRLHGCIIALATGRPVLAVSGDRKVESFMDAAGLGDWVCDMADIESLPSRLAALPCQLAPTKFIESARQSNRDVAARVKQLIHELSLHPITA